MSVPGSEPIQPTRIPRHVALIMDGNGRWAQRRGLPRLDGHQVGLEKIREVLHCFAEHGVEYVTLYAFSTENWFRPHEEVQGLMHLLAQAIERHAEELHREGVRILHLGRTDRVEPHLVQAIQRVTEMTKGNDRVTLNVAFDYGGRDEILEAVRGLLRDGLPPWEITEESFRRYLYAPDVPDPDLVVRTGGEMRLSNFLLWESAYAEFYSTQTLWPDFGPDDIQQALIAYSQRNRKFGALNDED